MRTWIQQRFAPAAFAVVAASAGVGLGACAASVVTETAATSTGTTAGAGGAGSGGADGTGGMCAGPPPPSPTLPDQPGCYDNKMNTGWVAVPCLCELWLENTTPGTVSAGVELTVTPPDPAPTPTGPTGAGIAFDDPAASWYAVWATQAAEGGGFAVTHDGGTTTVEMSESSVALAMVPLAACETRKAMAYVHGALTTGLSMHAVLQDGTVLSTTDAACNNPAPNPPPVHGAP
jgi:hypothetical protein